MTSTRRVIPDESGPRSASVDGPAVAPSAVKGLAILVAKKRDSMPPEGCGVRIKAGSEIAVQDNLTVR